jgi:hypothetical protein
LDNDEPKPESPPLARFENLLSGLMSVPKRALDEAIEALKTKREACDEPRAEDDVTE